MGKLQTSSSYNFRFAISKTALSRFREYVEPEFRGQSDIDLSRLLDQRVATAVNGSNYNEIVDTMAPNLTTRVARFEDRSGAMWWAVLRPNRSRSGGWEIITIITAAQAQENFQTCAWHIPNRPFAEKLGNVKPAPAKPTVPVVPIAAPPAVAAKTEPAGPRLALAIVPPAKKDDGPKHGKQITDTLGRTRTINSKRPAGAMAADQVRAREDFARQVLRQRPAIPNGGPDGLRAMMLKAFGIGLSPDRVTEIREELKRERILAEAGVVGAVEAAPAGHQMEVESRAPGLLPPGRYNVTPIPAPAPEVVTPPPPPPAFDLGAQLSRAVELEKAAKAEVDRAAAALAAAEDRFKTCVVRTEQLMDDLRKQRSGS